MISIKQIKYITILFLLVAFNSCRKEIDQVTIEPVENIYAHVVLLNFNGYVAPDGFKYDSARIHPKTIEDIIKAVKEDYKQFHITFTTDENVFQKAAIGKRQRVVIVDSVPGISTPRWIILDSLTNLKFYYNVGGLAVVGGMFLNDESLAYVFTKNLLYSPIWVSGAISHEVGHTLGLQHQFNDEPAIMGKKIGDVKRKWVVGLNEYGQVQNDTAVIKSGIKQL
jgi:hypothetical protein